MKNALYLLFSLTLLFSACEETPPAIDFSEPIIPLKDSTYVAASVAVPQHKAVLIEDITGVRCINCPDAAKKAEDIVALKTEDSVVVMAIYPIQIMNNFTFPYPNVPQLASTISKEIVEAIGIPQGLPNGYVDRKTYVGSSPVVAYNEWINYVNARLKLKTPVNINLSKKITGRKIMVEMRLDYNTQASSGMNHKFAIYLTESNIISNQLDGSGINPNYVHNHALRYSFVQPLGSLLSASSDAGRAYIKQYEYEIPTDYNIANCHLVCVVLDNATNEVINVRSLHL
ncbi:MAG: Omp28-related outer membrane protein [Bacteroidota bacterium]